MVSLNALLFTLAIKGIIHPKMKLLSLIRSHVIKKLNSFVHLLNTNEDIFGEIRELSDNSVQSRPKTCS